jgi:predicted ATPase
VLTRLEVDGFKTFEEFDLEVPPFLVIAGPNASGKSNLFDAIQLLARLADGDLRSAVTGLRGEPHELFRRRENSFGTAISLAAEVLLEPKVRDPWGQEQELIQTRFRYELRIERRTDDRGLERLFVTHEAAHPIRQSKDTWPPAGKAHAAFASAFLRYRRHSPLLETVDKSEGPAFQLHQDGVQGRVRPAVAAEATVLSSITTAEFKHLYALREELRSWRFLQLDPAALRLPASKQAPDRLEPNGANLAAVLARIEAESANDDDPRGALADISADLAQLIPGVTRVAVHEDEHNKRWELEIATRAQAPYSARVASDGTLRLVALLTALNDPVHGGLICFEEPENGVHPARLRPLVDHLRTLVTDPLDDYAAADSPLSQLLLSTHSPVVVAALEDGEGVFFDPTTLVDPHSDAGGRRTRPRIMRKSVQQTLDPDDIGNVVTAGEVGQYLATARMG